MIDAARLKDLVSYEPQSGRFTWAKARKGCRLGGECGRIARTGYREIGIDGRLYHAHRLAVLYMTGEWPEQVVDHINRDKADNRWSNLRVASQSQNMANVDVRQSNTSGHPGVTWDKSRSKWRAQIRIDGVKTNLGRFEHFEDAVSAVNAAARKQWGGFASWAAA